MLIIPVWAEKCICLVANSLSVLQAKHNPAYHAQVAGSTPDSAATQPWQLAAVQTAADFGDSSEDVARRYEQAAALLSGMLHPETAHRMTAQQLASDGWLQQAGGTVLGECPLTL